MDEIRIKVAMDGAKKAAADLDGVSRSTGKVGAAAKNNKKAVQDQAKDLSLVGKASQSVKDDLSGMAAKVGGLYLVTKGFGFIQSEATEARKATAATNAVIKSTGGVANVTAADVGTLANSISLKSGIDDEQIQGMSNMLLTFSNVRNELGKGNDMFNQATQAATDMGVTFKMGPEAAAKMLGKALQDPIKGMSALGRTGVQFTEQQKAQVKALLKTGDTLGAQKVILAEVTKQTGGSAAAAALPMDKLRVKVGNIAEAIGVGLVPIVDGLAVALTGMLNGIGWVVGKINVLMPVIASLSILLIALKAQMIAQNIQFGLWAIKYYAVTTATTGLAIAQGALNAVMMLNPFVLVAALIAGVVVALVLLWRKSDTVRNALISAWDAIKSSVGGSIQWIGDKVKWLVNVFKGIPAGITGATKGAFDGLKNMFRDALNWIINKWNGFSIGFDKIQIPGLPDIEGFHINTPNIPLLAEGGRVSGNGSFISGEAGAERVDVKNGGVTVTPLTQTPGASAGGGNSFTLSFPDGMPDRMRALAEMVLEGVEIKAAHA